MRRREEPVLPSKRRVVGVLLIWILVSLWMWLWWFNRGRTAYMPLFIPLSLAIMYEFLLLPSILLFFISRAKKPPKVKPLKGQRVAVITPCVPAKESYDVIEKQLQAMAVIRYPHDSWVLDEGNDPEVKRLAAIYGVRHFSRVGEARYNQEVPPFKAKTKAGNVNAWLDHVKANDYDFFAQLDIDHIPKRNYLDKVMGYFHDSHVAWVQAPSVYKNHDTWTSRGSSEQELVLQGPLQMGFYGHSQTPFIIGSHCTYRMAPIRKINGFQPTRAEDHLDTVTLAHDGWRGVYLPEIIAEGDGPDTLNTYLAQQFAWAYSMTQVLLNYSPQLLPGMKLRKRLQFLFAQSWYPIWSLSFLIMFMTPVVALLINKNVTSMRFPTFLVHYLPLLLGSYLVWWLGKPLMQPRHLRLSWRGILLHCVRWPVVLKAVISAAFNVQKPYMITPKGTYSNNIPSSGLYRPFLALSIISSLAILFNVSVYKEGAIKGQMIFAVINLLLMLIVCLVDLDIALRHASAKIIASLRRPWWKPVSAVATSLAVAACALIISALSAQPAVLALAPQKQATTQLSLVSLSRLTTDQLKQELAISPNTASSDAPNTGIFDPLQNLTSGQPYIRHSFVGWNDAHALALELLLDQRLHATPLVTLDPDGIANGQQLLQDIASGAYNDRLHQLFSVIKADHTTVYIRFAHEMDLANLYPWGNQDPAAFIAAYRHTVLLARAENVSNAQWVWSPAGNDNASLYYPGSDVVDEVGTTILYDQYWYGQDKPSFAQIANDRLWLMQYNKPVWIVEFGAGNADSAFQTVIVQDALQHFQQLGFKALVYLNIADSNTNGPNYHLTNVQTFNSSFQPQSGSFSFVLIDNIKVKTSLPAPAPVSKPYLAGLFRARMIGTANHYTKLELHAPGWLTASINHEFGRPIKTLAPSAPRPLPIILDSHKNWTRQFIEHIPSR